MAYFHTNYDASNLTVSVDDAEVTRALGVLGNKTPAALKVAVNTTARQTRKLMLTEVKKRYDLNAAGRRMIEDLRQRQKATNRRPTDKALHGSVCPQCAARFSGARPERQSDDCSGRHQR